MNSESSRTVVTFGETLWDLLPEGEATLGGAPFNFAYRVGSLGDSSLMVSRLGTDELGDLAWKRIAELGMDTTYLQRDPIHPTGTVPVTFDDRGVPSFTIVPDVAYDYTEVTDALIALAERADCICFGTLAQRHDVARHTVEQLLDACEGGVKLLDINFRPKCYSDRTIASSLRHGDILKCNDTEADYLTARLGLGTRSVPEFCRTMMERWSLSHCLVTLGDRGAFAMAADGTSAYVPGLAIEVIDTCGSGDAFTAGFIHGHLRGEPLADCLRLGNALGAMVATQRGATTPITPEALAEFMDRGRAGRTHGDLTRYAVGLTP